MRTTIMLAIATCASALVATASPARADAHQDQEFYRLLTEPDQSNPMVIWNFPLVRSQGIEACEREDAGVPPYQSLKELEYPKGSYPFDIANDITSSAETIYCPWHAAPPGDNGWVERSAPIYPPPIYPPLAWYPPQSGYSPAPGGGEY